MVRKTKRARSYLTRIDSSLRKVMNKVKQQAKTRYGITLNDREASRVVAKMIK